MNIEAEVSFYPVIEGRLDHPAHEFAHILMTHGCSVETGQMSSLVKGESAAMFEALRIAYEEAARKSACVLFVKVCNVCPL